MNNNKLLTSKEIILVIIVGLLLTIGLYLFSKDNDAFFNFLSILGITISLVGFYIALRQIYSLRAIAEHTNKEVKLRLSGFNRTFFISEVAQKNELLISLKSKIREKNYLGALHIMEDFKSILATLNQQQDLLETEIDNDELTDIIMNYRIDISNIESKIDKATYRLKDIDILTNTDRLLFFLKNIEAKLKT